MSKKLFIGLVATLAFAVMPAAAQAGHWSKGGVLLKEGVVVQTVTWGTLTLHSAAGELTCKNVDAGDIENPVGGGPGKDLGRVFVAYECIAPGCPAVIEVTAHKLPWPSVLVEGEPIRDETTGIDVEVKCFVPEGPVLLDVHFTGALTPATVTGTSATKPSFSEFGAGSGELSSEIGPGTTTGKDKVMGYVAQEVIDTKP